MGLFEEAEMGTIFLDEVNSMALSLQTKLLRVLQERQIRRVGDTKSVPINVRVLAATNEPLLDKTKSGQFREDLYYRLCVIPIEMPALRERVDDIPLSFPTSCRRMRGRPARRAKRSIRKPSKRSRPIAGQGNVRELENAIERACALCDEGTIQPHDLPPQVPSPGRGSDAFRGVESARGTHAR
jgi:DNA-binding NtrC family response regulator